MLHRSITAALLIALSDTPVAALDGAGRTGKSTLVRALVELARAATSLTIDDADVSDADRPFPPRQAGARTVTVRP